jgi:Tol biopolymer transport system component
MSNRRARSFRSRSRPLRVVTPASVALFGSLLAATGAIGAVGDTTLISRQSDSAGGGAANASSEAGTASADGRYVTFSSRATNLSDADDDDARDVFVRDTATGTTTLVSRESAASGGAGGNDDSYQAVISADGRWVAFASTASNLSPAQGRGRPSVYLRDLDIESTVLVSRQSASRGRRAADGGSSEAAISADGRWVAFTSAADNLSRAADKRVRNAFVRDTRRKRTLLVSRQSASDGGKGTNDVVSSVSISGNGRYAAFGSGGSNLARDAERDPSWHGVFVRDIQRRKTRLISRQSSELGGDVAQCCSAFPSISADGKLVAFSSSARDLRPQGVPWEGQGPIETIYVRDLERRTTELASRASISEGGDTPNDASDQASISADGRYVAFHSWAANLSPDDRDFHADIFVRDTVDGTTELVSRQSDSAGGAPSDSESRGSAISADGRFIAFSSWAENLSDDDVALVDAFLRQVR